MNTTKETAAAISIDDLRMASNQIDTDLDQIFADVFAQHRTWRKAAAYTDALTACDTPVKTCWELAEKSGYTTPGPFQSLIAENQWDHHEIWNRIATSAERLLPCPADDPLGPGVAVDETAQPKRGHRTVGIGTQWAGCLGQTTNCVTSVFLSYITPPAATWIAHGLFLPKKDWFTGAGATGKARRAAAGVPDDVVFQTKPRIARRKFQKLRESGVRFTWATGDDVYGRYGALRDDHEKNGEAYAYFVPKNFLIPTGTGGWHSAHQLAQRAQKHFELRSTGPGRYGPRWYEWAMIEAGPPRHYLLIRRPLPPTPDTAAATATSTVSTGTDSSSDISYVYCYVPESSPICPTLSTLVLMAGRRWPIEETIATGKGSLGWDHHQYRTWISLCHHTALCALAMLKTTALRARLENTTVFPSDTPVLPLENVTETPPIGDIPTPRADCSVPVSDRKSPTHDEVTIPLGDSLVPTRPDQPLPPDIGHVRLTVNEILRLVGIANAGLSKARTAFHLRWSRWRRRHQAIARWHHYRARLAAQLTPT